jgi:DNA-directed RNA polymerase specialized sigma24 family protein
MVPFDDSLKNTLPIPDDETAEELERIAEVLRKLDADDYRIVELYTADIPHAQMAQRLGISLRKLQYRIREVKLRIKKISKELY